MLPLQGAQVQSLVGDLRSQMHEARPKTKIKPTNKKSQFSRLVIAKVGGGKGVGGWGSQMEAFVYRMDKQQDPTL